MRNALLFPLCFLFAGWAFALEVSPGSSCALSCLDDSKGDPKGTKDSSTKPSMMECGDHHFAGANATETSKKFAACNSCLQKSSYESTSTGERDSAWFLHNNRAYIDWCVFGRFGDQSDKAFPDSVRSKKCGAKCAAIREATDYRIKTNIAIASYDFCDYQGGNYTANAESCTACLYEQGWLNITGNMLTVLGQMCQTKPGNVIGIDADVYKPVRVQLGAANSSTSSPTDSPTESPSTSSIATSDSGISKGAIAGIVLGALVGIALLLGGILFLLRRRKNKNKDIAMPMVHEAPEQDTAYGGYTYDSMPQQQKHTYAHEHNREQQIARGGQDGPAELADQSGVIELPSTPRETR